MVEAIALLILLDAVGWVVFFGGRWQYPLRALPVVGVGGAPLRTARRSHRHLRSCDPGIWGSVNGAVAIEGASTTQTVQILQALVAVVAVSIMIMAAAIEERRGAEEAAKESVSLLQATLESTADGILVVDRLGRMVSFNQPFVDMWRIPPEVMSSGDDQRALEFVLAELDDPEGFLDEVTDLYADTEAEALDVLRFKDGRVLERYLLPAARWGQTVGRA